MNPTLDQILALKTDAKNLRDLGPAAYEDAVGALRQAIALAEAAHDQVAVPDLQRQLAGELADCHGMIGGIQRRWAAEAEGAECTGHLAESCRAYDQGKTWEWDQPASSRTSTYNLVNRLTGRLLLQGSGQDPADPGLHLDPVDLPRALAEALQVVDRELARQGNFWTEADLALLRLLVQNAQPASAYADFLALSPPGYAFASVLDGLRPLAGLKTLPQQPVLDAAARLLAERRPAV